MKIIIAVFMLSFISTHALAGQLPKSLTCNLIGQPIHISHKNFNVRNFAYADVYRFLDGKLYTSEKGGDELNLKLYNKVKEIDPSKYESADNTIFFADDFTQAVIVHSNHVETYLVKIKCNE